MLLAPIAIAFYAAFYAGAVYGIRIIEFGITLGSFWGYFLSLWGRFGIILGSWWGHSGVILGLCWDHFGIILASQKKHFGIIRDIFSKHFFQFPIIIFCNVSFNIILFYLLIWIWHFLLIGAFSQIEYRVVPCHRLQPIALQLKRLNSKRQTTKKNTFFLKAATRRRKIGHIGGNKKKPAPRPRRSLKCT